MCLYKNQTSYKYPYVFKTEKKHVINIHMCLFLNKTCYKYPYVFTETANLGLFTIYINSNTRLLKFTEAFTIKKKIVPQLCKQRVS